MIKKTFKTALNEECVALLKQLLERNLLRLCEWDVGPGVSLSNRGGSHRMFVGLLLE